MNLRILFPSIIACIAAFLFLHASSPAVRAQGPLSASPSPEKAAAGKAAITGGAGEREIVDRERVEAEREGEALRKEVEISKKALEIEKRKAAVEAKEAGIAEREADLSKKTARSLEQIETSIEKLRKERSEARTAREKVAIAEEKLRAAEEKARLALEEVDVQRKKAAVVERHLREGRAVFVRKLEFTLVGVIAGYLLLLFFITLINRGIKELKVKHIVRKTVIYLVNILIAVYVFFLWVQNVNSITIFLGVAGAGVALALQEVLLCIAGWFHILVRRPFDIGDRIEFGGVKGDVIDIRLFQTVLLEVGNWVEGEQSTGRLVNVPNSMVFKGETYNYSRGFEYIWNEIKILVTFESDWKRAVEIMRGHAQAYCEGMEKLVRRKLSAMTRRYMIFYDNLTPIVYVDIKDSGVQLALRYLTEARSRRITQDALSRRILDDFEKEPKVNFAYTTYRIVK